jgi:hypothetical protein
VPHGRLSRSFHIVCSDQPRNGKTLFARLLADYLILGGRRPLIFDAASAPGGIGSYFPLRGLRINLASTAGQMALLDRALDPPLHDCVLDVPAHLVDNLFAILADVAFAEAAHNSGLALVIHFVVDRTETSLLAGSRLRAKGEWDRFIVVRNEAVTPTFRDIVGRARYEDLAREGRIVIPALDGEVIDAIQDRGFSFSEFAQDALPLVPPRIHKAVALFVAQVYRQFNLLRLAAEPVPDRKCGS